MFYKYFMILKKYGGEARVLIGKPPPPSPTAHSRLNPEELMDTEYYIVWGKHSIVGTKHSLLQQVCCRATLASSPGHSQILSCSCGENQLWDKIWECPGNKARAASLLALCSVWGGHEIHFIIVYLFELSSCISIVCPHFITIVTLDYPTSCQ